MTEFFRKAGIVSYCRSRQKLYTMSFVTLELCFYLFLMGVLWCVRNMSVAMKLSFTPYVSVFLGNDWTIQILFYGIFLWTISGLCRQPDDCFYIYARSGSKSWHLGNLAAMIVFSIIYTVLTAGIENWLLLLPHIQPSNQWGRGWRLLALTTARQHFRISFLPDSMILYFYTPVRALILSNLLQVQCLIFLGNILYLGEVVMHKGVGAILALFFIFLDLFLYNLNLKNLYKFSPVTLSRLSIYNFSTVKYGIHMTGGLAFLIGSSLAMIMIIIGVNKKYV